tara:strand:- start:1135 stop:1611 length:477 start_codon:yes stop_codon:yes gene_type:complete
MPGAVFRLAGKFLPGLSKASDALSFYTESTNPDEESEIQRVHNANIVIPGEIAVSALSGGLDFIPDVLEYASAAGFEPKEDNLTRRIQRAAPLLNPEHYLRLLSYYDMGNTDAPEFKRTVQKLKSAGEQLLQPFEDQSLEAQIKRQGPALGGLMMPMR